jgi:hypothetical protein
MPTGLKRHLYPLAAFVWRTRRVTRLVAAVAVVVALWACGPVYIPVPPPMIQAAFTAETWTDAAGTDHRIWTAEGPPRPAQARATFYFFNEQQNAGVIAVGAADGSYKTPPMVGTEGDHISVYFRDTRGEYSGTTCLILSEMRPVAGVCPAQ